MATLLFEASGCTSFVQTFDPQMLRDAIIYSTVFIALAFLVVLISDYYWYLQKRSAFKGIPIVPEEPWRSPYLTWRRKPVDYEELVEEAYYKYTKNGQAFALMWPRPAGALLILPPQSGKDYYDLPPRHSGFQQIAINVSRNVVQHRHQNFFEATNLTLDAWKRLRLVKLTALCLLSFPGRAKKVIIIDESSSSGMKYLSNTSNESDWYKCKATETAWLLVARLTGVLFFPRPNAWELGEYMGEVMFELGEALNVRRRSPDLLDWFAWNLSPTTRSFKRKLEKLKRILRLEIKSYLADFEQRKENADQEAGSLFMSLCIKQVLRKNSRPFGHQHDLQDSELDQVSEALFFIYIAISGPIWNMVCWMIIRAIRHSECIAPLREELKKSLDVCEGEWSFGLFKQTPKLDSFTREILRLHPSNETAGARYLHKPVNFPSLGLTIDSGTHVTLLSRIAQRDSDIYPNGSSFDPYRFYDEVSGKCNPRGTTTPSDTWLPFGIGNVVCPGRELGTGLCQMMFAKILLNYDLEFRGKDIPLAVWEHAEYVANPEISIAARKLQKGN